MIKITDIDSDSSLLYDNDKQGWSVLHNANDKIYSLSNDKDLISILKILYKEPSTFFSGIKEAAAINNLPESVADYFPLKNLIIFCISNRLHYWLDLSIPWFKFIKMDDDFLKLIKETSKDKKVDQKLRHKLIKAVQCR